MHAAPASESHQPADFSFAPDYLARAKAHIAKYPEGRQASAVMPLLDLAQRQQGGWIPRAAIEMIAEMLAMPPIRVYEVASFYSMYNLAPVGEYFIQVCRTTPCWLRGSDDITECVKRKLGISKGETTRDGQFTLVEVECLGACSNAPMVQINDEYIEDLDSDIMEQVIDDLQAGKGVPRGSQSGRLASAPQGDLTTLVEAPKELQVPTNDTLPQRTPVLAVDNSANKKTKKTKPESSPEEGEA